MTGSTDPEMRRIVTVREIRISNTAMARYLSLVLSVQVTPDQIAQARRALTADRICEAMARGDSRIGLNDFEVVLDGTTVVTLLSPRVVEQRDGLAGLSEMKRRNAQHPLGCASDTHKGGRQ